MSFKKSRAFAILLVLSAIVGAPRMALLCKRTLAHMVISNVGYAGTDGAVPPPTGAVLVIRASRCLSCQAQIQEFVAEAGRRRVEAPRVLLLGGDSLLREQIMNDTQNASFVDVSRWKSRLLNDVSELPARYLLSARSILLESHGYNRSGEFWDAVDRTVREKKGESP